jgi:hypothetical protein
MEELTRQLVDNSIIMELSFKLEQAKQKILLLEQEIKGVRNERDNFSFTNVRVGFDSHWMHNGGHNDSP